LTPQIAVARMVQYLGPGGILHIDVPNADYWGARFKRLRHGTANWGAIRFPHHQIGYYRNTLTTLFEQQHLDIIELAEMPVAHAIFGQVIVPTKLSSRLIMWGSKVVGHGYLLVGVARKGAAEEKDERALSRQALGFGR